MEYTRFTQEVQELKDSAAPITPEQYEQYRRQIFKEFEELETGTADHFRMLAEEMERLADDLDDARLEADEYLQIIADRAGKDNPEHVDGAAVIFWGYCAREHWTYKQRYRNDPHAEDNAPAFDFSNVQLEF